MATVYINYHSNYADYVYDTTKSASTQLKIDGTADVVVSPRDKYGSWFYNGGLRDYSKDSGTLYMRRTDYVATGYYNTKPDGSGISMHESPWVNGYNQIDTEVLIKHFNLTPDANGEVVLDLYPMWELANIVVNYHSNGADFVKDNTAGNVKKYTHNVDSIVRSDKYSLTWWASGGLRDYSGYSAANSLIMRKTGYIPTGYWSNTPDGTGAKLHEIPSRNTALSGTQYTQGIDGTLLLEHFGVSAYTDKGVPIIDLYPQWTPYTRVHIMLNNGIVYATDYKFALTPRLTSDGVIHSPIASINSTYRVGSPLYPYAYLANI